MEASEKRSHTSVDGLRWTQVDKGHGWSDISHSSSVAVDSVTEVIPAVHSSVYGSSLTQRHVTTDSNSWASSAAATLVPNNGMFLCTSM